MLDEFIAFDLETTGLYPPEKQQIIEYGAVRFKNGIPVETFQTFVRIQGKLHRFITKLTGIHDGMLQDAPEEEEAFTAFLTFIGDTPLVAHNMSFDYGFVDYLSRLYYKRLLRNELLCTLVMARGLRLPVPNRRLVTLLDHFSIPMGTAHRALDDALAAGRLYLKLDELTYGNDDA